MYAGQVVERGETDAVLQTPLHPYTRLLLSAVPNPEGGFSHRRGEVRGEVAGRDRSRRTPAALPRAARWQSRRAIAKCHNW